MSLQRVILTVTTPPTKEPVSLSDVKTRLRLSSTVDDGLLTAHITTARVYAERITGRSMTPKSYAAFYDGFPDAYRPLVIPAPPLLSVTAVKYLDSILLTQQTWTSSEYMVASINQPREASIFPAQNQIYPCPYLIPGCVEVDFTAGYGSTDIHGVPNGIVLPEDWAEGIRQLVIHLYEHPEVVTSEGLKEVPVNLMSFFRSTGKIWSF